MTSTSTNEEKFRAIAGQAAGHAIDNLLEILHDAKTCLAGGQELAAWGTLLRFDDAAEDLKAAIRLHRSANAGKLS